MRRLTICTLVLLFLLAQCATPLSAGDCGCGSDRGGLFCHKRRCCNCQAPPASRQAPPAGFYQRAAPPIAPLVQTVPVISTPVLLTQDRYVVSTTQLRAVQLPSGEQRTGPEQSCSTSKAGPMTVLERIDALERNVNTLSQAVNDLKTAMDGQQRMLESIDKRLP